MKTVFYTICSTDLQNNPNNGRNLDFKGFMNSFKRFHPDIEMVVFNEGHLKEFGINWFNAKATLGKIVMGDCDLAVNVDADHYFFDRCEEILSGDYDVACPANYNETGNVVAIKTTSGINGNMAQNTLVSEINFLQGGLIASPNINFWKHYEFANKFYEKFYCYENDILNLTAYLYPYKIKVLDGGLDYRTPEHNQWYGCSIIGKEKNAYIENGKIMCEGKPIKAYHFAHGHGKKRYNEIFSPEVSDFIKNNII